MNKKQRLLLFGSLGLFLTAIVLLVSNRLILPSGSAGEVNRSSGSRWQAFPTRAPQVTPTPTILEVYDAVKHAILNQDFDTAQRKLDDAEESYSQDPLVALSKARLAYVQEHYNDSENLIWDAIGLDPTNAKNWAFAGSILSHNGKSDLAAQAYATALELDPELAPHLFQEQWQIAVDHDNHELMTELADNYYLINPDDPLVDYYAATALLLSDHSGIALNILIERLTDEPQSPAILWFTLGQVYFERHNYQESVKAFEYTKQSVKSGDTSMLLITNAADFIIDDYLAKAYLQVQRCASAEILFRRLASKAETDIYEDWITQAVICQTPTPTPTHWMLSKQSTPTPSPN